MKHSVTAPAAQPIKQSGVRIAQRSRAKPRLIAGLSDLEIAGAAVFIVTAFLAAVLWAFVVPYNAAPDEIDHFDMDRYIAVHNQLPVFDQSTGIRHTVCFKALSACTTSYATQPVGSPLLGAALMKLTHAITGQPYATLTGPARLASALCIGIYAIFLYLISRALLRDRYMRLTALMIGAFIPQVTFLGAYVNDDSLTLAASAAVLYFSIVALRDGLERRTAVATGVSLGALALAKLDYYTVFAVFGLCALLRLRTEWRAGATWRYVRFIALAVVIAVVMSAWWYVRAQIIYGDITGLAVTRHHIDAIAPWFNAHTIAGQGGTLLTVLNYYPWTQLTFESFWGRFGYMSLRMDLHLYDWLRLCVKLCLVGAVIAVVRYVYVRRGIATADRWRAVVWIMMIALIPLSIFLSLWTSLTYEFEAQGRYLFPALIPIVLILAVGIHGWTGARAYRATAFAIVALAMLCLNVYALAFVNVPAYYNW